MGGKADTPAAPDYMKLAQQQQSANVDTFNRQTIASRPTVNTPDQTSTWTNNRVFDQTTYDTDQKAYQDASAAWSNNHPARIIRAQAEGMPEEVDNPDYKPYEGPAVSQADAKYWKDNWVNDVTLSPESQKARDLRMKLGNDSLAGVSTDKQQLSYDEGTRDKYVSDALAAFHSRNDPQFALQEQRMNDRLVGAGFNMTDDAFAEQTKLQQQRENDANLQAVAQAQQTGDQMLNNDVARSIQTGNFNSDQNQKLLAQAIAAITGSAPASTGSNTVAAPSLSSPDLMGAGQSAYGTAVSATNAQNAATAGENAALMTAIATYAAAAASDRRVKRDIERIGAMPSGLPVYQYNYIWDAEEQPRRYGVMAQEAQELFPDAVLTLPSGLMMVDYSKVH